MQAVGRIIAVQEQRFRLRTDTGQVYLLTLANAARVDSAALDVLRARQTQVSIDFDGQPNVVGGVARNVLVVGR